MEHPKRSAPFMMLKKVARESNFIFAIAKFSKNDFFFSMARRRGACSPTYKPFIDHNLPDQHIVSRHEVPAAV